VDGDVVLHTGPAEVLFQGRADAVQAGIHGGEVGVICQALRLGNHDGRLALMAANFENTAFRRRVGCRRGQKPNLPLGEPAFHLLDMSHDIQQDGSRHASFHGCALPTNGRSGTGVRCGNVAQRCVERFSAMADDSCLIGKSSAFDIIGQFRTELDQQSPTD
jgi:hypothetical protein